MERMPHLVKERKKAKKLGEPRIIRGEEFEGYDIDTRLEMIRALIPIGIMRSMRSSTGKLLRWLVFVIAVNLEERDMIAMEQIPVL